MALHDPAEQVQRRYCFLRSEQVSRGASLRQVIDAITVPFPESVVGSRPTNNQSVKEPDTPHPARQASSSGCPAQQGYSCLTRLSLASLPHPSSVQPWRGFVGLRRVCWLLVSAL